MTATQTVIMTNKDKIPQECCGVKQKSIEGVEMTLEEVRASTEVFLTPVQIAPILGCAPQWIRRAAHDSPELIGFPVCVIGTRTRIPRKPFLKFLGEGGQDA